MQRGEDHLRPRPLIRVGLVPLLALLAPAASALPQEAPLAVVLQVDGRVEVIREVRDSTGAPTLQTVPARVGTRLRVGDRVNPRDGGGLTVINRDGEPESVEEPTFLEAPEGTGNGELFARTVQVLSRAVAGAGRADADRRSGIEPLPGVPAAISPRNDILVIEAQPRLAWFSVDGAADYTVRIRTSDGDTVRYPASDTSLIVPRALAPGRTFYWSVEGAGRVGPEVRFRTISDAQATALVEGLASLRARGFDPDREGRLLKVIIFAELELFQPALAELLAVEARAGQLGPAVLALKGEILSRLGRLDEARRAFDRAGMTNTPRGAPPGLFRP